MLPTGIGRRREPKKKSEQASNDNDGESHDIIVGSDVYDERAGVGGTSRRNVPGTDRSAARSRHSAEGAKAEVADGGRIGVGMDLLDDSIDGIGIELDPGFP
jgi:hypothetical protein